AGNANTPAYSQAPLFPTWNPQLRIMSGSSLNAANGVTINGGCVYLIGNPNLDENATMVATIKGTFRMTDGLIGFLETPTTVMVEGQSVLVWGRFRVDGNAFWSGGVFDPGLDARPTGSGWNRNYWNVTGTLSIDASGASKPTIIPAPQLGQPVQQQTWISIIVAGKVDGDTPSVPDKWQLIEKTDANGVKTGWDLKFVGP